MNRLLIVLVLDPAPSRASTRMETRFKENPVRVQGSSAASGVCAGALVVVAVMGMGAHGPE